ncbi:hypothetical protein [Saccharicrinis sp. FJH54]|uniref:hypothetical protein n=1 Tax=Saccharicrinis sp. FJH54 TaxID=3344665 RepID=UPI0035D5039E
MKHHPNLILYTVFREYCNEKTEQKKLDNLILKYKNIESKHFYNALIKSFDVERLKNEPIRKEDIWLYHYIKYDVDNKVRKTRLIRKYESEIFGLI